VKRLALTSFAIVLFLTLGSTKARAQHSGSMQATAQVVDTRVAFSGLESAQGLAARWALDPTPSATIATQYARISLVRTLPSADARPEAGLEIRVDYLRN
jgi:hypothetical protein